MIHYTALLDANVLYSAPIRDLFLQLAVSDVFRARWTEDIHREWIDALVRNVPHLNRTALEHTRHLMDRAARDCLVTGYEKLIPAIDLPDPNDRHVLAAAKQPRVRNRLKSPPFTVQEYLINLSRQGLVATASELERFTGSI